MMSGFVFRQFAAVTAIAVMTVGAIANLASAAPLKDGDKINGLVGRTSPGFQFRNTTRAGAPTQTARGQEHTFTAQRGDVIEVSIDPEDGSTLRPALVLFDPTGRQVAYSENPGFFKYQVVRPGTYRLLVLGRNNSLGRYSLEIDGLSAATAIAPADQVMQNTLKLRVIGCGVPNVARIKIGTEERCTRDIEPGIYTYEETSRSIKLVDARRDLLASRLQLNVLDRCPSPATSVAQITLTDVQDGKDYTYCATPNRYVQAGAYRYNPTTDALTPTTTTQTPTTPTTPVTPTSPTTPPDARRQLLQNEYGLTVLDNCPAARTSFVVVNFPEGNQIYQYCANPNRLVRAGEYTYNNQTGALDVAAKPVNCTVTIGGICLVK
ncbi:MAG: hypothetical protein IGS48_07470 [Oscillatoriales cyanobacterium C42_A2020_001]|nr:hypothetical protein [Leptolyngbyaceae cyanobacterium C42_A2020_001]